MPKKGGQNNGGTEQNSKKEKKQKQPKDEQPQSDKKQKQPAKITDNQPATGGSGKKSKRQQASVEDQTHGYQEGGAHPYIPQIRQPYPEPNHVKEFFKLVTPHIKNYYLN